MLNILISHINLFADMNPNTNAKESLKQELSGVRHGPLDYKDGSAGYIVRKL